MQEPATGRGEVGGSGRGVCRCCLAAGRFRSVWRRYSWLGDSERYADMLRHALHVQIPRQEGAVDNTLICAVCITRLRDAHNFKKQVLACGLKLAEVAAAPVRPVKSEPLDGTDQPTDKIAVRSATDTEQNVDHDGHQDHDEHGGHDDHDRSNVQDADDDHESMIVDDIGCADNDEAEYIIAIEVEGEGLETPAVEPVEAPEVQPAGRRRRPRGAGEQTSVRSTSSRGPRPESAPPKPLGQHPGVKVEDNWMRVNASIIIANSQVCPFGAQRNRYKCFYCALPFADPGRLRAHTAAAHRDDKLNALKYIKSYSQVLIDITDLSCSLCEESFLELDNLTEHLSGVHEFSFNGDYGSGVIPFVLSAEGPRCHVCKETFYTFEMLNRHMNEHLASFVCDVCGFSYASFVRLGKHMLTHRRGNYECERCGKVFDTGRKRTVHIERTHDRKKTAVCNICSERFYDYDQKTRHMMEVHNANQRMFQCQFCPKEYKSRRFVMNHTRRDHLEVRNNKCQFCPKTFYLKSQLVNHLVKHSNEKLFQCDECKRKFNRKSSLLTHMHLHLVDECFVCDVCEASFTTKARCMYHRKMQHRDAVSRPGKAANFVAASTTV